MIPHSLDLFPLFPTSRILSLFSLLSLRTALHPLSYLPHTVLSFTISSHSLLHFLFQFLLILFIFLLFIVLLLHLFILLFHHNHRLHYLLSLPSPSPLQESPSSSPSLHYNHHHPLLQHRRDSNKEKWVEMITKPIFFS